MTTNERDLEHVCQDLLSALPDQLGATNWAPAQATQAEAREPGICQSLRLRVDAIRDQIVTTVEESERQIENAVGAFLRWMVEGTIVRVLGAGRARLAAAIPANRLAHGGARVFVQDDIIPMPHTITGGAILAASASGKTPSVLGVLRSVRSKTKDIEIVGIASADADEFATYCDIFIGIQRTTSNVVNPLRALADTEEYVISELLDGMVVAAGRLGGFEEEWWRLGHEDLGATGPYDFAAKVL